METSILVARLLALVYLTFGLGLLFSGEYYKKAVPKLMENVAFKFWGGFLALVAGFLVVTFHGEWTNDWTVLITVVGWLALVKGVILIVFPNSVDMWKPLLKPENMTKFIAPLVLLLGLVFGYFGFFV